MSNQAINLEATIIKVSHELVSEKILGENEINKLLGVLSSNGVYAMWVYAKSKKEIKEDKFFEKLKPVLNKVQPLNSMDSESFFQSISTDLHKLLFLKQVLEKTLIYAQYQAKALRD